jgi:hypothetical protein
MANYNLITEFLCLLVALYAFKKHPHSFWWLFIPFLAFTFLVELLASYAWTQNNNWLYNLYVLVQFSFFSFFFYRVTAHPLLRRLIGVGVGLFFGYALYEYSFRRPFDVFNLLLFTIDCFFTVVFAIFFLLYCIGENSVSRISFQIPALWITIGVVIFFSITSIVFNAYEFIRSHNWKLWGLYLDNIVPQVLSLIMYSCFAYAFLQWKKLHVK